MILNRFEALKDRQSLSKYTFDEFVTGSSNQKACQHAQRVAKNFLFSSEPLTIVADTGLGKTHLLASIGNAIISRCLDLTVCYYTAEMFVDEIENFLRIDKANDFLESFSWVDVLLFDDLDQLSGYDSEQKDLLEIFEQLKVKNKQVVVTANEHPKSIKGINRGLLSFLTDGDIAENLPADIETRRACLSVLFEKYKVECSDDAILALALNTSLNLKELLDIGKSISSYAKLKSLPVDLEMVTELKLGSLNYRVNQ